MMAGNIPALVVEIPMFKTVNVKKNTTELVTDEDERVVIISLKHNSYPAIKSSVYGSEHAE